MKVLMTADTVGGVWTYALELVRALQPHGVHTVLATLGALPSAGQEAQAAEIPGLELVPSPFKLEWMADPWDDVRQAGEWLLELERRVRPDLVHLNGFVHGALPFRAPVLVVGHSCVLSWWSAVRGEPAPAEWERYRLEVSRGLTAAARVTAPTAAMLSALTRHYGPFRTGPVVPNGRESTALRPLVKQPYVLAAGRLWDEAKNIATLDRAAKELPWPVYVAGESWHPNGHREAHRAVSPLGRLSPPEVARWMGHAAIYALPARYEPFGLSALEAAHAGCALVLGDIPSLREVWGDAAWFVAPDDPSALRRALLELIEDPGLRNRMAERARARAATFTPERMAGGYLDLYDRLLAACAPVIPGSSTAHTPASLSHIQEEQEDPACAW